MELRIQNRGEVSGFINRHRFLGHTIISVKGPAPLNSTYSDGSKIVRPINVAWVCKETNEQVKIVYEMDPPYWECVCGVRTIILMDDTECDCDDYYDHEWSLVSGTKDAPYCLLR